MSYKAKEAVEIVTQSFNGNYKTESYSDPPRKTTPLATEDPLMQKTKGSSPETSTRLWEVPPYWQKSMQTQLTPLDRDADPRRLSIGPAY